MAANVTDWITAISTGVLAIAAPGSIAVLIRQLRQTQNAAVEERHNSITPHLTLTPLGQAESATTTIVHGPRERIQVQSIALEAVGTGMASSVYLTFKESADRMCPSVTPFGFTNLIPGRHEHITIAWAEAIPDDIDEPTEPDTFHLIIYFFNALGRLYTQAYSVSFYRSATVPGTLDVDLDEWLTPVLAQKRNWIRLLHRFRREDSAAP